MTDTNHSTKQLILSVGFVIAELSRTSNIWTHVTDVRHIGKQNFKKLQWKFVYYQKYGILLNKTPLSMLNHMLSISLWWHFKFCQSCIVNNYIRVLFVL